MSKRVVELPVKRLRTDGGTQTRVGTNQEVVEDYAEALRAGALFPAVLVYHDRRHYWLSDGFHRLAAHVLAGRKTILCEVRPGTLREAILTALGSNVSHGLRRTNEDKRHAVGLLLSDVEWSRWSNREIAGRCGVSEHLVRVLRDKASAPETQMARRGGTTYPMRTAGINAGRVRNGSLCLREAGALLERARDLLTEAPAVRTHVEAALAALAG